MKKIFALLLAVMLVPAFALAETAEPVSVQVNDTLSISVVVPDGYAFEESWYGCALCANDPRGRDGLLMVLSMGYSEEYADRSINDLIGRGAGKPDRRLQGGFRQPNGDDFPDLGGNQAHHRGRELRA